MPAALRSVVPMPAAQSSVSAVIIATLQINHGRITQLEEAMEAVLARVSELESAEDARRAAAKEAEDERPKTAPALTLMSSKTAPAGGWRCGVLSRLHGCAEDAGVPLRCVGKPPPISAALVSGGLRSALEMPWSQVLCGRRGRCPKESTKPAQMTPIARFEWRPFCWHLAATWLTSAATGRRSMR